MQLHQYFPAIIYQYFMMFFIYLIKSNSSSIPSNIQKTARNHSCYHINVLQQQFKFIIYNRTIFQFYQFNQYPLFYQAFMVFYQDNQQQLDFITISHSFIKNKEINDADFDSSKYSYSLSTFMSTFKAVQYQFVIFCYNALNKALTIVSPMLKKHHSEIQKFNPVNSFSTSFNHSRVGNQLKFLSLKKSIFKPVQGLAQSYASRAHLAGIEVPIIDVVYASQRWLLLQTPNLSQGFFRKLNSGKLGNPYEQLLRIFKNFTALSCIYGYYRPTAQMIFLQRLSPKVWINKDVFSEKRMMPLSEGQQGEKQFIIAFLAMIESQFQEWDRVSNVVTIDETLKLLEWRSRLNRGSRTAVLASKQVFYRQNESVSSFEPNELGSYGSKLPICRSFQQIDSSPRLDELKPDLSCSVTIKDEQSRLPQNKFAKQHIFQQMFDSKNMKRSVHEDKHQDGISEVRKTKKKFALNSTSSTLQKFSQKWRVTLGKKNKNYEQCDSPIKQQKINEDPPKLVQHNGIQNELDGLFMQEDDLDNGGIGFQVQNEALQKIVQEMQEILIW